MQEDKGTFVRCRRAWPALSASLLCQAALAQAPPDAGSLLKQAEQQRPAPPPNKAAAALTESGKAAPTPGPEAGPRVQVRAFALEGQSLFGEAELQAVLAPWVGRALSLAELRQAAAAVCARYAEAGWLAHCDLPPQDITDGLIRIRVLEARMGRVRIEGQPQRVSSARAEAMLQAASPQGERLSIVRTERAVLLLSDLPGLSASAALRPGAAEGETDVLLTLNDRALFAADLSLDNAGQRSTGVNRAAATAQLNSPLGLGDGWLAQLMHTEGSDYLRAALSVPLGLDGWRASVSVSGLRYRLQTDELAPLGGRGTARSAGLELGHALLRTRTRNIDLRFSVKADRFDNEAGGATTSHYRSRSAGVALSANAVDEWGGGGANALGLQWLRGSLDLAGSPSEAADAAGPAANGRFDKLLYSANRQQAITRWLSASLNLAGQWAHKNLDSSERFYLGGPAGVRAYPSSEGSGSSGQLVNAELRAQLPANFVLAGFYDWGHVTSLVSGGLAGTGPNSYSLKGTGLALSWSGPHALNLRATWARRIGSNPNPTLTGSDEDGTLTRKRLWLQASMPL